MWKLILSLAFIANSAFAIVYPDGAIHGGMAAFASGNRGEMIAVEKAQPNDDGQAWLVYTSNRPRKSIYALVKTADVKDKKTTYVAYATQTIKKFTHQAKLELEVDKTTETSWVILSAKFDGNDIKDFAKLEMTPMIEAQVLE